MDPIEKRELKRKAWMRLAARKRRAGLLRGRVVVISLICFVVLWGIVFTQMATGNDPVLSAKGNATATRAGKSARTEIETTDPREVRSGGGEEEKARTREEEVAEAEPEEAEAEVAEAEPEEAEVEEAEAEVAEEPLVTSQS